MNKDELEMYQKVQQIAKDAVDHVTQHVKVGMSEKKIAEMAERYMNDEGIKKFWYHDVPALVLVGERTTTPATFSVPGKEYAPTDKQVGSYGLITIDVGPEIDGYWGDYARSIVMWNGVAIKDIPPNSPFLVYPIFQGLEVEKALHSYLIEIATPDMTCDKLCTCMTGRVEQTGFKIIDPLGNIGHSIEKHINDRRYVEKGNNTQIGDLGLFTCEPFFMREENGLNGYKREDVYHFDEGRLVRL